MAKRATGQLERAVLELLWDRGALDPGEVHALLEDTSPVAYTTAMTVLVRMWRKGWVERERSGRTFLYRPLQSREEHAATRMAELLAGAKDRRIALSHFVGDLSRADRAQLRKLLARRRRSN